MDKATAHLDASAEDVEKNTTLSKQDALCGVSGHPDGDVFEPEASMPTQEADDALGDYEAECGVLEPDNDVSSDEANVEDDTEKTPDETDKPSPSKNKSDELKIIVITYEEYDRFMEQAAEVELYNCQPYWPTPGDLEMHIQDFPAKEFALFLSWLLDMNGTPKTEAEHRSHKAMQQFLYERVQFVEELPEPAEAAEAQVAFEVKEGEFS